MILRRGLWIYINLDGIDGAAGETLDGKTSLTVIGSKRTSGDRYNPIEVGGLPKDNEQSPFAILYRKIESLVQSGKIDGPFGEDHPSFYARFEYTCDESPVELVTLLEANGIAIRIEKIPHRGDDPEVEQARKDFARWIDSGTEFEPNPKIEETRELEKTKKDFEGRMDRAERLDRKIKWLLPLPVLICIFFVLREAFLFHHAVGILASILMAFFICWIQLRLQK